MFGSGFQLPAHHAQRSDAEIAAAILAPILSEEAGYRFPAFTSNDAVTLGLSIRKRFRASSRHAKGKGLLISIQTISSQTLFACTVGELGHISGIGEVGLDSWNCLEEMMSVVKRTGHSSWYVEKAMSSLGKTSREMGLARPEGDLRAYGGGEILPPSCLPQADLQFHAAFPIWLEVRPSSRALFSLFVLEFMPVLYVQNTAVCPIAIVGAYSGSSIDDHNVRPSGSNVIPC